MNFKDFIEDGLVRKSSINKELAHSLKSTAKTDLKFLKDLEIDNNSARKIMSNYYDVLRSILEAIAILDGYKIYSHEAFTYFLRDKGEILIASRFDRFRTIRNKINYYGKDISPEEVKDNTSEITALIRELENKYLKDI